MIDVVVIITVSLYAVLGFYWGAIRQLIALTSVVAALVVTGRVGIDLSRYIALFVGNPQTAMVVAFVVVLLVVNGGSSVLASLIQQRHGLIAFGTIDHSIGAVLAVLQGLMTLVAAILVAIAYPIAGVHALLVQSSGVKVLVYFFGGLVLSCIPEPLQGVLRVVVYR
ncbi:MAG: hypothetical protein RLZZ297_215, partial [Chloroflexota bacterium]